MTKHRQVLGENIRAVRVAEGLSVEQLGEAVGFSASYISDVEGGRKNVSMDELLSIAQTLKISLNDLTAGM